MTTLELADCLIARGFRDPLFSTTRQLADCLDRMEAGAPYLFAPGSRRQFIDCLGQCLGSDARADTIQAIASDILAEYLSEEPPLPFHINLDELD